MEYTKNPIATAVTAALLLGVSGTAAALDPASSAMLDPQADALLKKMCDYLGGLKSFTADIHVFDEKIMGDGFKLSMLRSGSIKAQGPNKFHVTRKGMVRDQEFLFDGNRLVVHGKRLGMAIEVPVSGDADTALDAVTEIFGAELPAHDLLSAYAYTPLMEPVEESAYLGSVEVGGVTCRQLAFRIDEVDWYLWVLVGPTLRSPTRQPALIVGPPSSAQPTTSNQNRDSRQRPQSMPPALPE